MDEEDDDEEDLDLDVIRQTMHRLWDTKDYTTESAHRYIKVRKIYVVRILYLYNSKQSNISNDITVYNFEEKDVTLSYRSSVIAASAAVSSAAFCLALLR